MSHSHVRVPKRRSQPVRRKWLEYVFVSVITLMVVTPVFVNRMSPLAFSPAHETTYGTVLETRIDVVNLGSGLYGGYIDYQIEARVRYQFAGQTYERWMPASQVSTSRSFREAQIRDRPKLCHVYWAIGHPENPSCRIELTIRQ